METRFKIVALLIMSSSIYGVLQDKLEVVADAIDIGAPVAEDMVSFLESSVLKINEYYTKEVLA